MKWEAVNSNSGWSVRGEWPGLSRRYLAQLIGEGEVAKLMAAAPTLVELLREVRPFLDRHPDAAPLCQKIDRHLSQLPSAVRS